MANLKVSIIEKIKINGRWTNKPVKIPKQKPGAKGFYLQDRREGKFLIVWREGGRKRYSDYIGSLSLAVKAKEQKESYLASVAKGVKIEESTDSKARLTIAIAIDEFLAAFEWTWQTQSRSTPAISISSSTGMQMWHELGRSIWTRLIVRRSWHTRNVPAAY